MARTNQHCRDLLTEHACYRGLPLGPHGVAPLLWPASQPVRLPDLGRRWTQALAWLARLSAPQPDRRRPAGSPVPPACRRWPGAAHRWRPI